MAVYIRESMHDSLLISRSDRKSFFTEYFTDYEETKKTRDIKWKSVYNKLFKHLDYLKVITVTCS